MVNGLPHRQTCYAFGLVVDEMVTPRARLAIGLAAGTLLRQAVEKPIAIANRAIRSHFSRLGGGDPSISGSDSQPSLICLCIRFRGSTCPLSDGAASIWKRRVRLARRVVRANRWSIACLSVFFCALAR